MFEKCLAILLVFIVLFSVVGCSNKTSSTDTESIIQTTETAVTTETSEQQTTVNDKQTAREQYARENLDLYLSKNFEKYEIGEMTDLKVLQEYQGEALAYETKFNVKIDDEDCQFSARLVKNAEPSFTTNLHYKKILNELDSYLENAKLTKDVTEKKLSINSSNGEGFLPYEINSLNMLFDVAHKLKGYDIVVSADLIFKDKKDFCPENFNLAPVLDKFATYNINLYNTKTGKMTQEYDKKAKIFDENILDAIRCKMEVSEYNPYTKYASSIMVEKDKDEKYVKTTIIDYTHNYYEKIGDLTFCYDDRMYDLSIKEIPAIAPSEAMSVDDNDYTPAKNSYKITFKEKCPENITIDGLRIQSVVYNFKTNDNRQLVVTEHGSTLTVIHPLDTYKGLKPYSSSTAVLFEIDDQNYSQVDYSGMLTTNEFVFAFFEEK